MINPKTKLNWMNQKYIRYYPLEKVYELAKPFLLKDAEVQNLIQENEEKVKSIFASVRDYLTTLDDAIAYIKELSRDDVILTKEAKEEIQAIESQQPGIENLLNTFVELIQNETNLTEETYSNIIKEAGKRTNRKGRFLFMPIRIFTTGKAHGLELPRLFFLLGKERILKRIEHVKHIIKD
jgi:glutamyl/glutaminyl-tRNA synthetase